MSSEATLMGKTENSIAKENLEEKKFRRVIQSRVAESLYLQGFLEEEDFLSKEKLIKKMQRLLQKSKDADFHIILVHHEDIEKEAYRYIRKKNFNFGYVFLGTYFEHITNDIIKIKFEKEKLSEESYKEIIRGTSLKGKLTWVLEILKLPKFNSNHIKTIEDIAEKRNAFVHYKYPVKSADKAHEGSEEWRTKERNVDSAIKYIKTFHTRVMYGGKRKNFKVLKQKD